MKKILIIILISMLFGVPVKVAAENINLSVQVVPRAPTDTIDDFDFSFNNESAAPSQVKGAEISPPAYYKYYIKVINYLSRLFHAL